MKHLQMLSLAAVAAAAIIAFLGVGSASATTLETTGFTENGPISITATLKAGTTLRLLSTDTGFTYNTCTGSLVEGATRSPYTGTTVTGPIATLVFGACWNTVTPHLYGTLHISHIAGTTNGTVSSSGAEVTSYSSTFGTYLPCRTGGGAHLGTLTGSKHSHAALHINAVLNCTFVSAEWIGTYTVTSPTGLGVSA
jgi:hypothetical protein